MSMLLRTCSNQLPSERDRLTQQCLTVKTNNERRGVSMGNKKDFKLKKKYKDLSSKVNLTPNHQVIPSNQLTSNHLSLLKENEMLRLQITDLLKENKELKLQNEMINQCLINEELVNNNYKKRNKKWTFKLKKNIKDLNALDNDDEQLKHPFKTLSSSIAASSLTNSHISFPFTTNTTFNQKTDSCQILNYNHNINPQKFKFINSSLNQIVKDHNSRGLVNLDKYELNKIKERTKAVLDKYNLYLQGN